MQTSALHLTKPKILRPSEQQLTAKMHRERLSHCPTLVQHTERLPPPPPPPTPGGKSGICLTPDRLWKTGTGCTRSGHLPTGLQSGTAGIDLSVAAGCMALRAELGQSREHSPTGTAWSGGSSDKHPIPSEQQVTWVGKGAREGGVPEGG